MSTVRVDVTLGGALLRLLPTGSTSNTITLEYTQAKQLTDLLSDMGVEPGERLMVIVNGALVGAEQYASTAIKDGDRVSLVPPIQAG